MAKKAKQLLEWFGNAGHLCVAHDCLFHLHTHVNGYCVSTVGEYFPSHQRRGDGLGAMEAIGAGEKSFYETMVFELGPDGSPASFSEIDGERYATAGEANAGHTLYITKYLRMKRKTTTKQNAETN